VYKSCGLLRVWLGAAHDYQADPLADDSDDEKELWRADKAAWHGFEDRKPRG